MMPGTVDVLRQDARETWVTPRTSGSSLMWRGT
jgi:hypothetical protein